MSRLETIKSKDEVENAFKSQRAFILKNSPICPISRSARTVFEKFSETCDESITLFIVDVIHNRDISKQIEYKSELRHESPQILYLENGEVKWHASHWDIKSSSLLENAK